MAKIRHRLFEIFEFDQEASDALASKSARVNTYALDPELWRFHQLDASIRTSGVVQVTFKQPAINGQEAMSDLGKDLTDLAEFLTNDSRVLLDFVGVNEFDSDAVTRLGEFRTRLQTKGSRVVLCNLEPAVHASFFPHLSKKANSSQ